MDAAMALTEHLARWLGESRSTPYSPSAFHRRLHRLARKHGLGRNEILLDSRAVAVWITRMYLEMAAVTYARLFEPAPLPDLKLVDDFQSLVESAPPPTEEFHQSRIDSPSACRRALEVHKRLDGRGEVLMIGDDDGTALALSLLGEYRLVSLDLDQRGLDWLKAAQPSVEVVRADVSRLPDGLASRFDAVVTDPVRDTFGLVFLRAARACLKPGGRLFLADHPDWNPKHRRFLRKLDDWGFVLQDVYENWHAYPAGLPSEECGDDEEMKWFCELSHMISLWSHLFVLQAPF